MVIAFKNGRFEVEHDRTIVRKDTKEIEILRRLRSFLDEREPGLVHLLVNTWRHQGKAITYKELREAILAGDISIELWEEWQQDYSRFVAEHMRPAWEEAIEESVKALEERFPGWYFNPMADGVRSWVANRAAEFVTNSTQTQIDGLRAVIQRAAALENRNVDDLARTIRSMVGLTKQQTTANLNYYNNLLANGMSEKRAQDLSMRYAARQHRYRGYNIARTELAFSYNQGAYEGTKQAQAAGYLGEVVKVWSTADDERTCKRVCAPLDGKEIAMDDDFDFPTRLTATGIRRTPPAHPGCRCAVMYKEVSPPTKKGD